jgi:hypothetical protein
MPDTPLRRRKYWRLCLHMARPSAAKTLVGTWCRSSLAMTNFTRSVGAVGRHGGSKDVRFPAPRRPLNSKKARISGPSEECREPPRLASSDAKTPAETALQPAAAGAAKHPGQFCAVRRAGRSLFYAPVPESVDGPALEVGGPPGPSGFDTRRGHSCGTIDESC